MKSLIIIIIVMFSSYANAGLFGPNNFDDCILQSMKGVTSDMAARAIYQSCEQKFSKKVKQSTRNLSADEIANITGRGSQYKNYFSGQLLNQNKNITITQITISITSVIGKRQVTNFYNKDIEIKPNSTGEVFFQIITGDGKEDKFEWNIAGARGF
jgi:hypothetical protein